MNKATRATVATFGVVFGLSSMSHGFFETLQGNTPTGGMVISAIGEAHRMWPHGNEYAFTLIPNFLVSGILAVLVGLSIIVWSIGFVHTKHGPLILILLFVSSFLVGGGIAQVVFFTLICAVSTRINQPLTWWRKVLPQSLRKGLAKVWLWLLIINTVLMLSALAIAVFGFVPGVSDPDSVLNIMVAAVGGGWSLMLFTFVAGFAYDIERADL